MDIDTLNGLKACLLFKGLTENEIIDLMHLKKKCCPSPASSFLRN